MEGLYRHHTGELCAVLGIATDDTISRAGTRVVIYWSLAKQRLFVREMSQFVEKVKWPDGKMRPRFDSLEMK